APELRRVDVCRLELLLVGWNQPSRALREESGLVLAALAPAGGHLAFDALDRQRQAAAPGVDLEDLDLDLVARLDDLARVLDMLLGQLADVHEAFDAFQDLHEGAERDDLGDGALELVTDVVGVDHALPGILLGLLETQRDAL